MDDCDHCEKVVQPYLDRTLSADEVAFVESHLAACVWCANRFKFEEELRGYVRVACTEPMPPDLVDRLSALRTPLL